MMALHAVVLAAVCPAAGPVGGSPGDPAVAPPPSAAAQALNTEGKQLYRQRRWQEAEARYRAAGRADPAFLAPALNAACALTRQERFAEAVAEAAALIRRGFVPWGREVLEAADLAPLHVRPEMGALRAALAESAAAWGASLGDALFFVARTRPPVSLAGQGVLVLGLGQEIYAWWPHTARYRQVTAEDGRVLAFVRSDDGRTLLYLRAGKLVRNPGTAPALRALSVRRLEVPTMSLGPAVPLPGDLAAVEIRLPPGSAPELRLSPPGQEVQVFRLQGDALLSVPISPPPRAPMVRLTAAAGVPATARTVELAGCPFRAADDRTPDVPHVRISAKGRALTLDARYGAGLAGLAFPGP
jgi:hypothetical protein